MHGVSMCVVKGRDDSNAAGRRTRRGGVMRSAGIASGQWQTRRDARAVRRRGFSKVMPASSALAHRGAGGAGRGVRITAAAVVGDP